MHIIDPLLREADINVIDAADTEKVRARRKHDIVVHDFSMFDDVVELGGSLGAGESYMAGKWDCDALDVVADKLITHRVDEKVNSTVSTWLSYLFSYVFNYQTKARSYDVER